MCPKKTCLLGSQRKASQASPFLLCDKRLVVSPHKKTRRLVSQDDLACQKKTIIAVRHPHVAPTQHRLPVQFTVRQRIEVKDGTSAWSKGGTKKRTDGSHMFADMFLEGPM